MHAHRVQGTKMTDLITRDMTVGEIVEQYPQVAEVFLEYGLHCVGCHVAFWETIEEGARGHGMDEETIDMMLRDANSLAQDFKAQVDSQKGIVKITTAALNRAKELMQKENKHGFAFRIAVIEGGCSGYSYKFTLDKDTTENDELIEQDGVLVAIDKESLEKLANCTIDYVDTFASSGYKVHNPNAKDTCGCGSSFG
jgi:iron-sulfur cluster assembly protein